MVDWLRLAAQRGTRVLVGDPGRAYLPSGMTCLATYHVTTSRELENAEIKHVGRLHVFGRREGGSGGSTAAQLVRPAV